MLEDDFEFARDTQLIKEVINKLINSNNSEYMQII